MRIEISDEPGLSSYSSNMATKNVFLLERKCFLQAAQVSLSIFSLLAAWREKTFFCLSFA
jgi:hypothetical protein